MAQADELFLGVDGGGSKTDVVVVAADGRRVAEVTGPGTTLHEPVTDETLDRLAGLIAQACQQAGVRPEQVAAAGLGISGVDFADELDAQRALLFPRIGLPAERATLVNDGVVALWGGSPEPRAVVLQVGSAFTAAYRAAYGEETPFDHHNLGQVVELRRDLLVFTARSLDGREPDSALPGLVLAHFGVTEPDVFRKLLVRRTFDWQLARRVVDVLQPALDQGDAVAASLVTRAAESYAADICCMIDAAGGGTVDVVLGGGMLRHAPAVLREGIAIRVTAAHPAATVHEAELSPALGGALLAAFHAGQDPAALFARLVDAIPDSPVGSPGRSG